MDLLGTLARCPGALYDVKCGWEEADAEVDMIGADETDPRSRDTMSDPGVGWLAASGGDSSS